MTEEHIELWADQQSCKLKKLIIAFVNWLYPNLYIFEIEPAVMISAEKNVRDIEDRHRQRAGDWKRARVYAVLCQRFPYGSKREYSKAIEIAVDHLKKAE